MRLIHTTTLEVTEFIGGDLPAYGILSHTWEAGEPSFRDAEEGLLQSGTTQGFDKVRKACQRARDDGLDYCWVDTCCIDKSSSSELTEAINSMFQWYASAQTCYAYLADLGADESTEDCFDQCRWFTRGWTLQELIAPKSLRFYDEAWCLRGTKQALSHEICKITRIDEDVLHGRSAMRTIPICQRMAWAAGRETTRREDVAYCLLGIFGVSMPLIYGEGPKAFARLQEEIIRQTNDLSMFCWQSAGEEEYRGFLAESPDEFASAPEFSSGRIGIDNPEYTVTNKGIRIVLSLYHISFDFDVDGDILILPLNTVRQEGDKGIGVYVKHYGNGMYARVRSNIIYNQKHRARLRTEAAVRYLSKEIHPEMAHAISNTMKAAFDFMGSDFNTQHFKYVSTTPSDSWDNDARVFLRSGNAPFVAFHLFKTDWDNTMQDNRFIIAFGVEIVEGQEDPWYRVGSYNNQPTLLEAALKNEIDHVKLYGRSGWEADRHELFWLERHGVTHFREPTVGTFASMELTRQTWNAALSVSLSRKVRCGHQVYSITLDSTGAMRCQ